VKTLAVKFLSAAGLPAVSRRHHRGKLAILMYHGVEAEPLTPHCSYVVAAAALRRQLRYLKRHFHVLALEEALDRLRDGTLPDRAVTLTFDDGTRNLATQAAPILRELRLPAAVFLATGPMGTDEALWPDRLWLAFATTKETSVDLSKLGLGTGFLRNDAERGEVCGAVVERLKGLPDDERIAWAESIARTLAATPDTTAFQLLSWDEARAVAGDGLVTLHPHTVTHPILAQCSDEKVEYEISESCAAVARETNSVPTIFAYPNGRTQDFDDRARAVLHRRGIRWALATNFGFAVRDSDPFALPRIGIGSNLSFARFRLLVSGTFK
jgi:peptidoglycan/xylan/chitin deacetylase (PgdA/CDA1 family)